MSIPITLLQESLLQKLATGKKLHLVLQEYEMPSKSKLEEWLTDTDFNARFTQATSQGARKRRLQSPRIVPSDQRGAGGKRKRLTLSERLPRPALTFTLKTNGFPTTCPNTPADAQRIKNSLRLTAAIGDGATYQVPGAEGYSEEELLAAPTRYAHLLLPERPIKELQARSLELLRAGVRKNDVREDLELKFTDFKLWREDLEFSALFNEALLEGREARKLILLPRTERRTTRLHSPVNYGAKVDVVEDARLKELALEKLALGFSNKQLMALPGIHSQRLSRWKTDEEFRVRWEKALQTGKRLTQPKEKKRTLYEEALLQDHILDVITSGADYRTLFGNEKFKGFNANCLMAWRKNSVFRERWEQALLKSSELRGTISRVRRLKQG